MAPRTLTRRNAIPILLAGSRALAGAQPGTLHVRVVASDTQSVTPCTILLRDAAGTVITSVRSYTAGFRSTGEFRQELPAGPATLTVTKGFDYAGEKREIMIRSGETTEIEIRLNRRTSLAASGWVCGDNHVHMTHGEARIAVDFDYLALAARAEGLDYMSVAQRWNLPQATASAAEAECQRVSKPDCRLTWNLEAPKNYFRGDVSHCLGHGWFLGARATRASGQDIAAEIADMNAGDYQSEKTPTPNFETHALIHAQGGIVSYTHPCRSWVGKWGGRGIYPVEEHKFLSNLAQELPFDTVAGPTYDTVDILMQTHEKEVNAQGERLWYSLLNHGYRLAATASSDASFDNEGRGVPGKVRVYTRTNGSKKISGIAAAMKRGANFVTSGPLLLLSVDGHESGDRVVSERPVRRTARVRAWASGEPGEYLSELQLVRNGEVIQRRSVPKGQTSYEWEYSWDEDHTGWMIARCQGRDPERQVAVTNPVFFDRPGWKAPEPSLAKVRIQVKDSKSGAQLGGVCTALEMIGREPRTLATKEFRDGILELEVPATARLRIESPEYRPMTRSVFLDYKPLLDATLNMKAEQLLTWSTFEELRAILRNVELLFSLEKS